MFFFSDILLSFPNYLTDISFTQNITLLFSSLLYFPLTVSVWGSPPGYPDSGPSGRRLGLYVLQLAVLVAACRSAPVYRLPGSWPAAGSLVLLDCGSSWNFPESSLQLLEKQKKAKVKQVKANQGKFILFKHPTHVRKNTQDLGAWHFNTATSRTHGFFLNCFDSLLADNMVL